MPKPRNTCAGEYSGEIHKIPMKTSVTELFLEEQLPAKCFSASTLIRKELHHGYFLVIQ